MTAIDPSFLTKGGDWGVDRLVPDIVRAALAGEQVRVRSPDAIRPWQHVLNPLSGYLVLAQALADDPGNATAWNFGPDEHDARPVRWLVERIAGLWPEGLDWGVDEDPHPPEAHYLKLDSSRATDPLRQADDALEVAHPQLAPAAAPRLEYPWEHVDGHTRRSRSSGRSRASSSGIARCASRPTCVLSRCASSRPFNR